jgi:hypothetical protein
MRHGWELMAAAHRHASTSSYSLHLACMWHNMLYTAHLLCSINVLTGLGLPGSRELKPDHLKLVLCAGGWLLYLIAATSCKGARRICYLDHLVLITV